MTALLRGMRVFLPDGEPACVLAISPRLRLTLEESGETIRWDLPGALEIDTGDETTARALLAGGPLPHPEEPAAALFVTNHALGAGQQSSHLTSMGETGVPGLLGQTRVAEVAAPAAVVSAAPAAPVAPAQETQSLGAAPAAPVVQQEAAPTPAAPAPRADRG